MFTLEGDEITAEGEIIADEDGHARANLQGHGFVIAGAQAKRSHSVAGFTVRQLQDAEEYGAVPAQRKLFTLDMDALLAQGPVKIINELYVGNRFEGVGGFRCW